MKNVLWVGGPPGKTFQKIVGKLAEDRIAVAAKQEPFSSIPAGVDAVLACIDMLDHTSFEMAKAAAKAASLPFAAVRLDYSRTRIALMQAGLVGADMPPSIAVAEASEQIIGEAVQDPAEALRQLLRSLPLDLARLALTEAGQAVLEGERQEQERAERAARVAVALEAFRALQTERARSEWAEALTEDEREWLLFVLR